MTPNDYPPRSLLYVPGSNARALEKAQGLAADMLIIDLEDAVPFDRKIEAREAMRRHLHNSQERMKGLAAPAGVKGDASATTEAARALFARIAPVT